MLEKTSSRQLPVPVIAIIFASGVGTRMGGGIPKQFLRMDGRTILEYAIEPFQMCEEVNHIIVVTHPDYLMLTQSICEKNNFSKVSAYVFGGATAQDSIYNGLVKAGEMYGSDAITLLHDGVRPYIEDSVIRRVIDSTRVFGNGITFTPCYETLILSQDGKSVNDMPVRNESYTAQAPQGFHLGELIAAHNSIRETANGYNGIVDQATLYHRLGKSLYLVPGNRGNVKVTTIEDLYTLQALLKWHHDKALGKTANDFQ